MRIQKAVFVVGILLLMGFFITGVANAAESGMSQWIGKWFSYKVSGQGIEIQPDGSGLTKSRIMERGYFTISSWDGARFMIDAFYLKNGNWETDSRRLGYIAGTDLTFLFEMDYEAIYLTALMQGSNKNGILSSAKITTYGGIVFPHVENTAIGVGNVSLTAKMIAASKVRVPEYLLLPVDILE
jgi:hypothetical protein